MHSSGQEKIVKILAEYQDDDGKSSIEGLRAVSLENQLYEVRNIPVFASGVHLFDIVRCRELPDQDICPTIIEVVTPSDYQTIGVVFFESVQGEQQAEILSDLQNKSANLIYERATKKHMTIAMPNGESQEIFEVLESYKRQNKVEFYEILE